VNFPSIEPFHAPEKEFNISSVCLIMLQCTLTVADSTNVYTLHSLTIQSVPKAMMAQGATFCILMKAIVLC
jgi:hypothetical protein